MTKENLEILEFEDKKTKAGKRFTRFKTSEGWMSCFDKDSCEKLKDFEGKTARVEIMEANGFKNIRKFLGASSDGEEKEVKEEKKSTIKEVKNEFPISMKVAYAKDLFIAEMGRLGPQAQVKATELMKTCCDLVKIAEEKFKEVKKVEVVKEKPKVETEEEEIEIEQPEFPDY